MDIHPIRNNADYETALRGLGIPAEVLVAET